jgi:hypothetical protein
MRVFFAKSDTPHNTDEEAHFFNGSPVLSD